MKYCIIIRIVVLYDFNYSPMATDSSAMKRFGSISVATLMIMCAPLFRYPQLHHLSIAIGSQLHVYIV